MKTSTDHSVLIDQALNYSRVTRKGCLVSNKAADELLHCDASVLDEIEDGIRNRVVPDSGYVADHNELLRRHPGLLSLWRVYFHSGKDERLAQIVEFLRSLDGPVLATAILGMRAVWENKVPAVALPMPLLELIREVAANGPGIAAEIAQHQLTDVWNQ